MNHSPEHLDQPKQAENPAPLALAEIRANAELMAQLSHVPHINVAFDLLETYGPEQALEKAMQRPEATAVPTAVAQERSKIKRNTTQRLMHVLPFLAALMAGHSVATAAPPGDPPPPPPRGAPTASASAGGTKATSDKPASKPTGTPGVRLTKDQIEELLEVAKQFPELEKQVSTLAEENKNLREAKDVNGMPLSSWILLLLLLAGAVGGTVKLKDLSAKVAQAAKDSQQASEDVQLSQAALEKHMDDPDAHTP